MKSFPTLAFACLAAAPFLTAASPLDPAKFAAPIRVACVGDSITAGSHAGPGGAYPTQLQKLLGDHWLVGNFGVSGRTVLRQGDFPYWNDPALTNAESFRPDVVIILLGTNDTKPRNWLHGDEFGKDYSDLVNIFRGLPSKPVVFVCRPTPVAEPGNYGINEAVVQEEIPIIDRIAAEAKLDVIDMHAALEGKPQLLADRVHPNAEGAREMAETACRALTGRQPVSARDAK